MKTGQGMNYMRMKSQNTYMYNRVFMLRISVVLFTSFSGCYKGQCKLLLHLLLPVTPVQATPLTKCWAHVLSIFNAQKAVNHMDFFT